MAQENRVGDADVSKSGGVDRQGSGVSDRKSGDVEGGVREDVREGVSSVGDVTGDGEVIPETGETGAPSTSSVEGVGGVPDTVETSDTADTTSKADGSEKESAILERMEATFEQNLATQDQIQRITQMLGALETSPSKVPQDGHTAEPVGETHVAGDFQPVGDTITRVAILAGMREEGSKEEEEVYMEACQPSNSAQVDDSMVVVAGEIVSGEDVVLETDNPLPTAGEVGPKEGGETAMEKADLVPPSDSDAASLEDSSTSLKGSEGHTPNTEGSSPSATSEEGPVPTKQSSLDSLDDSAPPPQEGTQLPLNPILQESNPQTLTIPSKSKRPRFQLAASFSHSS